MRVSCIEQESGSPVQVHATVRPDFAAWLTEHGKTYGSTKELKKREEIFINNVQLISNLNQQHKTR